MDSHTVEEEHNILFRATEVPYDEELRNSWFIILPTTEKGLGIFETFTDIIPPSVENQCIESDILEINYAFIGSSLYRIGDRVRMPYNFEVNSCIRWLDTQNDSQGWEICVLPYSCADPFIIGVYGDYLYLLPSELKCGYYDMYEGTHLNLTIQRGYVWNTTVHECLPTSILPPIVEGVERQWNRIRACAALDGQGLLIAMDGEENNFFLHSPVKNDWEICHFKDPLPKFFSETSFAASNGRLYILEVRGMSPAFLYIYDIKEGKLVMDKKPVHLDDDLWSMDEQDRVIRIVPVADGKLCFLWLGPVSFENENGWPPVRTLHCLKVKFCIHYPAVVVVGKKVFRTNLTNLFECLPFYIAEVEGKSPLYLSFDAFQKQEDNVSVEAVGTRQRVPKRSLQG